MIYVGYGLLGAAAILFEPEARIRFGIAWLLGLIGIALLQTALRCARAEEPLVARILAAGTAAVCGALPLVFAIQIAAGSWTTGLTTDAKLASVVVGETKAAVHEGLGDPLQHMPAAMPGLAPWPGSIQGEDCDVYEKDPGLQGGMYANVCYLDGKVVEILPFR
jgi:hypothetical protein